MIKLLKYVFSMLKSCFVISFPMKIAILGYPTFLDPVDSCVTILSDPIGRLTSSWCPVGSLSSKLP